MEVKIKFCNRLDLIEKNYSGQYLEQMPIYLEIDWERKKIWACTRNYQIGGTPARQYRGLVSVYPLPSNTQADALAAWVRDEVVPIVDRLVEGFSTEWDGHNRVGRWTDDAYEEEEYFRRSIEEGTLRNTIPTLKDGGGLVDVRDYLSYGVEEISATTTNEDLEDLAIQIEDEARRDDIVIQGDLEEYLKNVRNDLIEEAEG